VGAGSLNVAAHFLVHRDGRVDQLAPETRILRHVIGLNHCTVGVENVGDAPLGAPGRAPLTAEQVRANVLLIGVLVGRFPAVHTVFGHHEYRRLEGGPLFAERDPAYRTAKRDPGDRFMAAVRAGLQEAGLVLGAP
jgi:N-acetyl-anhydromuramyl-L-alanine amidase AmpD